MQESKKKVKVAIFLVFTHRFQLLKQKKFWTKNAENFHNASIFFQIFTISKMKTRTIKKSVKIYSTVLIRVSIKNSANRFVYKINVRLLLCHFLVQIKSKISNAILCEHNNKCLNLKKILFGFYGKKYFFSIKFRKKNPLFPLNAEKVH